ncbi:MAG TPA: protoporphyrinogen oxidase [bacterium]
MMKKVCIIGGGISGLTVAYRLRKYYGEACEVVLIEKENRLGGTIRTERDSGFTIEGGPDCFITEKPWAREFCSELNLADRLTGTIPEHKKTFILWQSRLHQIPEGLILMIPTRFISLLTTGLFSITGKLRMGMEFLIPKKKTDEDESLAGFVRRRFGEEALERIAEPLVAGVHAGDPDNMSVKSSFPRFIDMERKYRSLILGMLKMRRYASKRSSGNSGDASMFMTLKNGLSELIETLAELIGPERILIDNEVVKIQRTDKEFRVLLNNSSEIPCTAVVFAIPSYSAGKLLTGLNPELPVLLNKIPFVSTATVTLVYDKKGFNHDLDGYGFVIPKKENRRIMAVTWTSSKFPCRVPEGYVMLRSFVGGANNQEMVSLSDEELLRVVHDELKVIMGIHSTPHLTRIYRWFKAMPQYTIGHEARLQLIDREMEKLPGIFLAGSSYRGIGISDCVKNATETADRVKNYIAKIP